MKGVCTKKERGKLRKKEKERANRKLVRQALRRTLDSHVSI
jgi:hypothetical protein